jgi:hypothetical protein
MPERTAHLGLVAGQNWKVGQEWEESWAQLGGQMGREEQARCPTFRGAVIWVALAVPAGKVCKDPLTLLCLPHQWEGLQEGSERQFKAAEGLPEVFRLVWVLNGGETLPHTYTHMHAHKQLLQKARAPTRQHLDLDTLSRPRQPPLTPASG